ncbi:PQQ-binding-like beta-propeller repeat protein [Mariniflexile sp. AS56]|uniref:outer membrane protein assembly factor BamB family protein n=1 Tax=Mariniflexile sp. AS56 TaxID=3063957 RepID=UPI0026EFAD4F|nr:PQQ-binding-like beta-propeller repeat protein [Mariniflexile sp. AS56]MDO7173352.1 PQQ-binding-like beta-propeller repeat protein [Mariniflexile sp. AS56]
MNLRIKQNHYFFHWLLFVVFAFLGLFSCKENQGSVVQVPDSENQWPMSGGPDGSYKIKTTLKVPVKWSVRDNENIKWKKTLPAGGQSGIAVWDDKLFFTINPPLDTPAFSVLQSQFDKAQTEYNTIYTAELNILKNTGDADFKKVFRLKKDALNNWEAFLALNENYQNLPTEKKQNTFNRLLTRSEEGRMYSEANKNLMDYVNSKSDAVLKRYEQFKLAEKALETRPTGTDVVLYCMDANNGETLWTQTVKGLLPSDYNYAFSDSTTPCPMTDGDFVWAINASGGMACFSMEGDLVWERTWMPTVGRPFNKQFDSVLFQDVILNVEPPFENDSTRVKDWNYLHAFNKYTGKHLWTTKEAITHYNTPVIGETADGKPAILIARGGPHGVPERPVGLSLISLDEKNAGNALWNWEPEAPNKLSGYGALNTQHWDKEKVSWIYKCEENLTVNSVTGKLIGQKALHTVDQYIYNEDTKKYTLKENVVLQNSENEFHCNMAVNDYTYYMVMHKPFIARHHIVTGKNEHLELPFEKDSDGGFIWKIPQTNDGLNAKGQLHSNDARVMGDGFQRSFLGSPVMVNNYIFFTNAVGMVYVIDTNTEHFDETALVSVNDLGEKRKTWTVNTLSFANGHIYHRTLKEIICIGE